MTELSGVPPSLVYFLGALFAPLFVSGNKRFALLAVPVMAAIATGTLDSSSSFRFVLHGFQIELLQVDALSLFFHWVFHLITFLSLLYGISSLTKAELIAALLYSGAALGVVSAGEYFSFYVFWEILGLSALLFILERKKADSSRVALHYMLMHLAGGLSLLFGLLLMARENAAISISALELQGLGSYLVFLGIGMNSAWPLFHTWLTDAYPKATIGGTVFLSALTTKAAIYALARFFPGTEALVWIGTAMAAFPIFYAVIENDLRKVLAYSLINQVGFMVVGIGVGGPLGLNGALAHAFNDIIFKGLLFMSVGAVMYRTGKVRATDLGGLYRCMPLTCVCCIVGAASISAFPLFSGFVSKSMVVTAVSEQHLTAVWLVLLFASAGVFHHAGIKIPFFVFFGHDSGLRVSEAPRCMSIAMVAAALCCLAIGSFPEQTVYKLLPFPNAYEPYTAHHVVSQLQLLFFSALAFVVLLRSGVYPAEIRCVNLDAEWITKKLLPTLVLRTARFITQLFESAELMVSKVVRTVPGFMRELPLVVYKGIDASQSSQFTKLARGDLVPVGVTCLMCLFALCVLSIWSLG